MLFTPCFIDFNNKNNEVGEKYSIFAPSIDKIIKLRNILLKSYLR
jgi:hypothetical protein